MNYALVGAFVLGLGGLLIVGALWLASGGAWQKKYDLYAVVSNESVAGLNLNAPVKYNGVDVGLVHTITLDHANPNSVQLLFALERGTPVKEDTVATLKTQGLTGIAYVELSGGSAQSPTLQARAGQPYPQIRTAPSLITRLENVLTSVLAKIDSTSTHLDAMLSKDNQTAVQSALADIALVARTVAARSDSLDASLRDAAATLKNTAHTSAKLDDLTRRLARSADAIDTMGQSVTQTSENAGKTLDNVGADVRRFSIETLPELERLLGELSSLSTSLRHLSDQTQRDPSGLIFGRTPVANGPGETKASP